MSGVYVYVSRCQGILSEWRGRIGIGFKNYLFYIVERQGVRVLLVRMRLLVEDLFKNRELGS